MSSFYSEAKVIHRHRVHAKDGWRVRILEELLYLRSITRQPGVNDILLGTICAMAPPGGFQPAHQPHVSGVVRAVDHCVDVPAASVVWGIRGDSEQARFRKLGPSNDWSIEEV